MKKNTETTITETTISHANEIDVLELDDMSLDDAVGAGGDGGIIQNGVGVIALCLNGVLGQCFNDA